MFSTILKEVTGYFDRRALISAFFPSLVFWGLAVILVLAVQIGWTATLQQWEGLSATAQALLLVTFFVWVAFWTFLTLNFRTALVRLYEGYWPDTGLFAGLLERRRKRWQDRWDELDRRDHELEEQEIALSDGQKAYEELRRSLVTTLAETAQTLPADAEQVGAELDTFLERVEGQLEVCAPSASRLIEFGQEVRGWWQRLVPYLKAATGGDADPWTRRRSRLDNITRRLEEMVNRQLGEVEEKRLRLNRDFFLYYPPRRDDVMPTQLGNVLKAAEMYAQKHYHLDAVLIWSRLQSALPKEFSDPLQDAKTALDLMVTLSGFTLLFGLPLSAWLAVKSSVPLLWWVPLLLAAIAFLLRFYPSLVIALVALGLSVSVAVVALVLTLSAFVGIPYLTTAIVQLQLFLAQLQFFLTLVAGVLLLASVSYQNAVQAGLAYGERIKAAFDLYRWKVLEELHLQLPPDFKEERKIWEEVCGLLYRSYEPDSRYYRYVKQEATKEPVPAPQPTARLPVPAKALPAYHPIVADDIIETEIPEAQIPVDAARKKDELIGQCPLKPLPAHEPVPRSWLTAPTELVDKVAMGISATPTMVLGDDLKTGDVVDLLLVPAATDAEPPPTPILFESILILDVRPATGRRATGSKPTDSPFVVIIALPVKRRREFATKRPGGTLLISRKPMTE